MLDSQTDYPLNTIKTTHGEIYTFRSIQQTCHSTNDNDNEGCIDQPEAGSATLWL